MYGFPRCVKAHNRNGRRDRYIKKNEEKKERKIDGKLRDIKGFNSIANSNLISHRDITG